jgi:hypothetical protein
MNTIQLSELKMGNLVTVNNPNSWPELKDIPMRVIGVAEKLDEFFPESKGDVSVVDPEGEVYHQFNQFILPIHLSEEWLIKLGAETVGEFKIFESFLIELGRNRRLSISVQPGNQYIWIQEYTKEDRTTVNDLVCLFNGDYDGTLYVHTLQNIFHAIRGTELTLTESEPPNRE